MGEPLARAEFRFTTDEQAELVTRAFRHLPALRARRWRQAPIAALLGGVVVYVFAGYAMKDPSSAVRIVLAGLAAVLNGAIFVLRWPRLVRKQHERHLRARHGDGPHRCEVELHPTHVQFRQHGQTLQFEWSTLLAVHVDGTDLELVSPRGVSVVRGRAFDTVEARDRFQALAHELHARAQSDSPPS